MNRYNSGFVDVRNPFNPDLVSRIYFDDVDAIMFCTKNPLPIIPYLNKIDKPILFHVTLTPYKKDIEPNVIKKTKIIEGIKKVSNILGKNNIVVRYDPVFLNDVYTLEYHKKCFERMCCLLDGYVNKVIISFIDDYKNVRNNKYCLSYKEFTKNDYKEIGISFSRSAKKHGMSVQTCFEKEILTEYGFIRGECLSRELAFKLTGKIYKKWNARGCNCAQMVDIGAYNTCSHFCKYCYANYDEKIVKSNIENHDKNSSLIIGHLKESDIIKIRRR